MKTTQSLFEEKKRTKCVKIIFISVKENINIIHKNNVTRRSKALLTKRTIFHIRMYNI